jgi:hypothetical protein
MTPPNSQDDPADALDDGANGLAEAIALDFGGKPAAAPARPAAWGRWFRIPTVIDGSACGIALGAPRVVPRLAH